MEYMKLISQVRNEILRSLAGMPAYLQSVFSELSPEEATHPGAGGGFSPVEQVWHLADLEREGFGERIQRLLSEEKPHLPNFEGGKIAKERKYLSRSLLDGLEAFSDARFANLVSLQAISQENWVRRGVQEGVGEVSLCEMPGFILQHDSAHKIEIEDWLKKTRPKL